MIMLIVGTILSGLGALIVSVAKLAEEGKNK